MANKQNIIFTCEECDTELEINTNITFFLSDLKALIDSNNWQWHWQALPDDEGYRSFIVYCPKCR